MRYGLLHHAFKSVIGYALHFKAMGILVRHHYAILRKGLACFLAENKDGHCRIWTYSTLTFYSP